ncbi:hypothetical protein ACWD5R_15270 [Streptomyces sp. NPDC002514]|uniref:hypothetical protein n=1 Tax=unclassified Streptomyces TaxID=2593676 RepID=UPI0036882B4E
MAGMVLAAVSDFGWGSIGKLRLILDRLGGVDVALDEATASWANSGELLGARHRVAGHRDRRDAAVALVINDPRAADEISDIGVPVVYVDSLPYLWTLPSEIPRRAALHCAQRSPLAELPAGSPLHGRQDLRWIEPIVPPARRRGGRGEGCVVNVGGMHSHLVGGASDAYLRLVVIPLVERLVDGGHTVSAVCGNLPDWACARVTGLVPSTTTIGVHSGRRFEEILSRSDILFTSPGSTTMLQAAAVGIPTVLLPPQNLSQILHPRIYLTPSRSVLHWPSGVLDPETVEKLRPSGEDAVLEYVYESIVAAEKSVSAGRELNDAIDRSVALGSDHRPPLDIEELGTGGAGQVARVIRQALLAPLPRPRTAHRRQAPPAVGGTVGA